MNPSTSLEGESRVDPLHTLKAIPVSSLRACFLILTDLMRRPSLAYVAAALLITYLGKIEWYLDTLATNQGMKMGFLAFFVQDFVFWALAITGIWWLENQSSRRSLRVATTLITGSLTLFFAINVVWLDKTGFQLTPAVIHIGLTSFEKVSAIIEYEMGIRELLRVLVAMALPLLLSFVFQVKWMDLRPGERQYRYTLLFPALLLTLALLGYQQQRNPDLLGWRRIADNALLKLVGSIGEKPHFAAIPSHPKALGTTDIPAPMLGERPNIILIFMESVAHRATSLGEFDLNTTPFLASVAAGGLQAERMRVVMPHSTKSFFATLCGANPALQQEIVETADNFPRLCLPQIFNQAGYRTAFMQAPEANFEDLVRLAERVGFSEFYDWNNIQPQPELVGYLGADDQVLEEAATRWISQRREPYFLTLFTSATHHPYIPPQRMIDAQAELAELEDDATRYLHLVRDADQILERLLTKLKRDGKLENTVVVIMGDHGEAFGESGGYQHDNIFADTGLRIPFVIHAPQRIQPGTRVSENRNILDVAPTLLELAELPAFTEHFAGTSLLEAVPEDRRHYFACFFNYSCVGFVEGNKKIVHLPDMDSWLVMDLSDPRESNPQLDTGDLSEEIAALTTWYDGHRFDPSEFQWRERDLWNGLWRCSDEYGSCEFQNRETPSVSN